MNKAIFVGLALAMPLAASAQDSGQALAATMDVFVFPAAGQDSSQQSKDEVAMTMQDRAYTSPIWYTP